MRALDQAISVELAGTQVLALAEKAIYWPEKQILLVADTHFGKAAAYRALGQPVPQGTTELNLKRLNALLARYPVNTLIFLGDFLHAPQSHAPDTLKAIKAWRDSHTDKAIILIRGNHDLRAGDPPADLALTIVDEPLVMFPFAFRHTPASMAGHHVIAGHIHPSFLLSGNAKQKLRLPCFYLTDTMTILPAFGEFTGTYPMKMKPSSRVLIVDGMNIWQVP